MNDQKIYQYLARKPDSRAQDIADALDVELREASDALRSLVDVGDVVRYSGVGKNGLPAQLYNLSLTFKRTKDGAALLASTSAEPAPDKDPAPVPAPTAPAPVETPIFSQLDTPIGSKVDRAVAYVLKHGSASDEALRIAMGIEKPAAPAAYLATAIRNGKLHKADGAWKAGRELAPAKEKFNFSSPSKHGPVAEFGPTDQPEELKPAEVNVTRDGDMIIVTPNPDVKLTLKVNMPAPDEPTAYTPPVFRCGLWSDGVLELQRNGRSLVELTRCEQEQLGDFMARMRVAAADKVAA